MRLLSFPDVARWYMEKLFPWERRIVTAMGPIVQPFVPVPLPKDNVYAAIEALFNRIDGMKEILTDPKRSSVRLVLNPEKMVIKEAQRALTYLNLYGYVADAVICNRVFPPQLQRGYFAEWSLIQGRYLEMIQRGFSPLPIWEVPLFDREVVGLEMLERMGRTLFAERDPLQVFIPGPIQTVRKKGPHYFLRLKLPFLKKDEVSLLKRGDELVISIGNFRRDLILPRALANLAVKRARLEDGYLVVRFGRGRGDLEDRDG
jgi:arsenite-transporting ATPase